MFTVTHTQSRGARRRAVLILLAAVAISGLCLAAATTVRTSSYKDDDLDGRAHTQEELQPSVAAAFPLESYAPGARASLVIFNKARGLTLQLFHVGPEHVKTIGYSEMQGVPVTARRPIGSSRGHRVVQLTVGAWPSGVYFARLTAADGRVGFAPFIVRPRVLGEHRVAVVMPTMTWQAYNLRDDDGDGIGDSWYANWNIKYARLGRPFLNRGVPYNYHRYDMAFLHWLAWNGKHADFLSDSDLASAASAGKLAAAYDLIVFPGHHEYVTTREYDVVQGYRDLGGNLAFLSANNFFWQVVKHGDLMERTKQWRDLGRPEAGLIGVQYTENNRKSGVYVVKDAAAAPWLFAGTDLKNGSQFGHGGTEIDAVCSSSPAGIHVIAEIPNLFGDGRNADMTYYQTAAGAKVFAAGAFTLAGAAKTPDGDMLLTNLWAFMSQP